jgi:WD40 repeat protein
VTDEVFVWSETGDLLRALGKETSIATSNKIAFSRKGDVLISGGGAAFRLWSVPGFELIRELHLSDDSENEDQREINSYVDCDGILKWHREDPQRPVRWWPLDGGAPTTLGSWLREEDVGDWGIEPTCTYLLFTRGRDIFMRPLEAPESSEHDRLVGQHPDEVSWITWPPTGEVLAAGEAAGEIRFWSMDPVPEHQLRTMRGPVPPIILLSPGADFLLDYGEEPGIAQPGYRLWDLTGPPDARPLVIWEPPGSTSWRYAYHPSGRWLAKTAVDRVFFWQLDGPVSRVLDGHTGAIDDIEFTPDGEYLVTGSNPDRTVRLWPLSPQSGENAHVLWKGQGISKLATDSSGHRVLVSTVYSSSSNAAVLVRIEEGQSAATGLWPEDMSGVYAVTFSDDGRKAAAGTLAGERWEDMVIRVWGLESGDVQVLALCENCAGEKHGLWDGGVQSLQFTPDGDLLSSGASGLRRWNLEEGRAEWLIRVPEPMYLISDADRDSRLLLTAETASVSVVEASNLTLHDLAHGTSRRVKTHGDSVNRLAIDPTGTVIATSTGNVIRVGSADGSEPHLLIGHEGDVGTIEISPDGRWVASGAEDANIRLWPMPDLSKPPLHTLPRTELIAKLKTLTNLRLVRDEESSTGWKFEVGPFPGWASVPEW